MEQITDIKSTAWQTAGEVWESTMAPNALGAGSGAGGGGGGVGVSVTVVEEAAAPTLTVAAIVGVTLVVLVAIVFVFLLGVLIDCRHQRILEKRLSEVRRPRSQRRASAHPEGDAAAIVDTMEEPEPTAPPSLATIP